MPAAASPTPRPAPAPAPSPRRASPPRAVAARLISHDYDLFLGELPTQRRL